MNFSSDDKDKIFQLAQRLTGTQQDLSSRLELLPINVWKRMQSLELDDSELDTYLEFAEFDEVEKKHLISSLTIHTTYWFREKEHFDFISNLAFEHAKKNKNEEFRVWSAACSTGEEVYSLAFVLQSVKYVYPSFKYHILGTDIDPISVDYAQKGVYDSKRVKDVPPDYNSFFLKGSGRTEGLLAVKKEIRANCNFKPSNLMQPTIDIDLSFDVIICRNVLIYFNTESQKRIISNLLKPLKKAGTLVLGLSEQLSFPVAEIEKVGKSCYQRISHKMKGEELPGVLFIDDDPEFLELFKYSLEDPKQYRCFYAEDEEQAIGILTTQKIDLINLDLKLQDRDGGTLLSHLRSIGFKMPVIVVSGQAGFSETYLSNLMRNGVVEFIDKSLVLSQAALMKQKMLLAIIMDKPKPVALKTVSASSIPTSFSKFVPEVIAIGASTGGTQALQELLMSLPQKCPPLIVVQHISSKFARSFAEKLSQVTGLKLEEFKTNQIELVHGKIYLALDDYHIVVKKINGKNHICKGVHILEDSFHRPSVDVLFKSLAAQGVKTLGCLLTGMGKDGAQGLLQLKSSGALTLAQNAESCIVYGMPGEATKIGAVTYSGDLQALRNVIDGVIS